jgi:predicted ATPase
VVHVIYEMRKTKRMMKNYTDADIVALPHMVNATVLTAMQINCITFLSTMLEQPVLAPILTLRMVQHTLKYGLSGIAPLGYSLYALILCGPMKEVTYGTRMSLLSLELLKRFDAKMWLPRVYTIAYFCLSWTQPLRLQLKPLFYAHRVGLGSGDIECAMLSGAVYSSVGLHASCIYLS